MVSSPNTNSSLKCVSIKTNSSAKNKHDKFFKSHLNNNHWIVKVPIILQNSFLID